MRKAVFVVGVAAMALVLSGCQAVRSVGGGVGEVREGFGDAVSAPLEDLNLRRQEIPIVLLQAQANPYDLRNLDQCTSIAAEVRRLDDALGPDADEPPAPDGRLVSEYASDAAADATLAAIRDTTTDFIPMRSWVRRLTGAEQHSRQVQGAIQAGRIRRAFLKGIGMRENCAPPAAPRWFTPEPGGARRR